jgi:hypothetical protein
MTTGVSPTAASRAVEPRRGPACQPGSGGADIPSWASSWGEPRFVAAAAGRRRRGRDAVRSDHQVADPRFAAARGPRPPREPRRGGANWPHRSRRPVPADRAAVRRQPRLLHAALQAPEVRLPRERAGDALLRGVLQQHLHQRRSQPALLLGHRAKLRDRHRLLLRAVVPGVRGRRLLRPDGDGVRRRLGMLRWDLHRERHLRLTGRWLRDGSAVRGPTAPAPTAIGHRRGVDDGRATARVWQITDLRGGVSWQVENRIDPTG